MKFKSVMAIKTKEEARQEAIKWQSWISGQSLSYGDFLSAQVYLKKLARKFNLTEEFKENCII